MTIEKCLEGSRLDLALTGRLDTATSPDLESLLRESLEGVTELNFDLAGLDYISSAGLRVLLMAQKAMNKQGEMTVKNANEDLMEIFEVTGFTSVLNFGE